MPSSGIVAIDPANNDAAVIDASTLSAAPEECPTEHEIANELSQEDEDQPALSPMPHKKAPMVTPRADRKVTTSPSTGGSSTSSNNTASSRHTPVSSKGGSKKKVAVATPVAAEESSSPKKSKKSSKANNVPMKTMKHFFGKAGTAKANKDKANSSSTKNQKKEDGTQPKEEVDTSLAEPSADNAGEEVLKAKAENISTTKKGKAKANAKPKQPQKNSPAEKKAKTTPVDIISLDMDDSPMDALAIVSRKMSAGRRSRVTGRALAGQKNERDNKSVENKAHLESSKDATIIPKDTPKFDEIVTEIEEATSSSTADNDGEDLGVDSAKEKVDEMCESDDDDASVALDDSDTSAAVKSDNATEVEKSNSLSELPASEVECTEETMCDEDSDKTTCAVEKEKESIKDQPVVIIIDEPTPETETSKKDDTTNTAEAIPPKNKRDPNAPKKPKSALNLYQNAKRNEFKAANPDTKAGEIVSEVDIVD
jgi:hypothetical protein